MRAVRLRHSLHLLPVLHVMLAEGSTKRTGRRLGMSPSAVQRALRQLADVFGEPLFVRRKDVFAPTPRAKAIGAELGPWLAGLDALFTAKAPVLGKQCRLATTELCSLSVVPELHRALSKAGIAVTMVSTMSPASVPENVDFLVAHGGTLQPGFRRAVLVDDRLQVFMHRRFARRGKRQGTLRLDDAALKRLRFVCVPSSDADTAIDRQFDERGIKRQRAAISPSIAAAAHTAAASGFACVGTKSARTFFKGAGLLPVTLPFSLPSWPLHLAWRTDVEADATHEHHREVLLRAA